ncbi:MAG: MlaE family lipid ABC transporter permease subunit [Hyphomicrobium sp.]|nr:MlaE family lipid ABC transporter permease subunit [Hyphomicrobium sp.]
MNHTATARLGVELGAGSVQLSATGDWSARNALALDAAVRNAVEVAPRGLPVSLDLSGVDEIDTFGAWHLANLAKALAAQGSVASVTGLAPRFAGLLTLVGQASEGDAMPPPARWTPLGALEKIGRNTADAWASLALLVNMLGAIGDAAGRTLRHPSTFRLTSAIHHIDRVGLQAVPIILLITFLIGCIIAQQGFFHFRKFGADDYVVDMVGILVLREIGVLIVAIMVAGRSGSSYTAELGSMKMREEIDALRTMGFDPIQVLVLPRVLALVIALPILTFLGSMSALYGGELVAWLYGGMSPDIFVARLKDAISITHFKVGMIKAPFMALVIGVVACTEGLRVGGSAESLGLRTTASVVTAIFLVIVLDGLFAIFFASIGM